MIYNNLIKFVLPYFLEINYNFLSIFDNVYYYVVTAFICILCFYYPLRFLNWCIRGFKSKKR